VISEIRGAVRLVDASVRQVDARVSETRAATSLVDASLRLVVARSRGELVPESVSGEECEQGEKEKRRARHLLLSSLPVILSVRFTDSPH